MAKAKNHDTTGLPPGFSYMEPPASYEPDRYDLKLMMLRLQQLLRRDNSFDAWLDDLAALENSGPDDERGCQ
jgi:hypothetical protein